MSDFDDILKVSFKLSCTDGKCIKQGPIVKFTLNFLQRRKIIGRNWVDFGLCGGCLAVKLNGDQKVINYKPKYNLPIKSDGSVSVDETLGAAVSMSDPNISAEKTTGSTNNTTDCKIRFGGANNSVYFAFTASTNNGLLYGISDVQLNLCPSLSANCGLVYDYVAVPSDWYYNIVKKPKRTLLARILFEISLEECCEQYVNEIHAERPISDEKWNCSNVR
jgi:hypothetical protein